MVTITIGRDYGIDMRSLDFSRLYEGIEYVEKTAIFSILYDSGEVNQFRGTDFTYNDDLEPTGGTVKSYSTVYDGDRIFTIDGLDIEVTDIVDAAITFTTKDDYALIKSQMSGNDRFIGGDYNDYALGYDGKDRLSGKGGADFLVGGKGADTFIYNKVSDSTSGAYDAIGDFSVKGGDIINLSAIDANGKAAGSGTFDFIGTDDFSGSTGELRAIVVGDNTGIFGDVDGDTEADFIIALVGEIKIGETDFIL